MKAAITFFVCATALFGCGEPSDLDPDAAVEIRGAARHLDGTPVTKGTALVVKDIGLDDFAASAPIFFGTMGMVCVAGADLDLCDEEAVRTELAQDGSFEFSLRGRDVQSGFGTTSTLWATVAAPPTDDGLDGPSSATAFKARTSTVTLPPLRLWEPTVRVRRGRGTVRVGWPDLPGKLGRNPSYQARFESSEGALVWSLRRPGSVDPRVLEDASGGVSVDASVAASDTEQATTYRSAQQPFSGPAAPPSRGASCAAVATGRRTVTYDPCPLTDGALTRDFDPALDPECRKDTCPHHDTAVVVDLGDVRKISLVVVRADEDVLVVDSSLDARRWSTAATVDMKRPHATAKLASGTRARYVRIAAERWPLPTLRELSVW